MWWLQRIFYLLALMHSFNLTPYVVSYEEDIAHTRIRQWSSIHDAIHDWERCKPESMKPYAYLPSYNVTGSNFPKILMIDTRAVLSKIAFHAAAIIAIIARPSKHPHSASFVVADGVLVHSHQILGVLKYCDDQAIWSTFYWAYRLACCYINDPNEREEATQMIQKYFNNTGIDLESHNQYVAKYWNLRDRMV